MIYLYRFDSDEFHLRQEKVTGAAPSNGASTSARVAVLGASGYTGEEVVRLLAQHPSFAVTALTGESNAGKVWLQ